MKLPLILAGPLLRRVEAHRVILWLVTCEPVQLQLRLVTADGQDTRTLNAKEQQVLPVGQRAFVQAIVFSTQLSLAEGFRYSLCYRRKSEPQAAWQSFEANLGHLLYPNESEITVPFSPQLKEIWHGSCRKPHYPSEDGLAAADQELERRHAQQLPQPQALFMTGDQVYVDDLCGPMLQAVHQVINALGLHDETFPGTSEATPPFKNSQALYTHNVLYGRRDYLPSTLASNRWSRLLYRKTALITSQYCDNHLITFAEVFALYLLSWSPTLWEVVHWPELSSVLEALSPPQQLLYIQEKKAMDGFIESLPRVQRLLAHLPTYMIFDDHDVTDDWNLSEAWENAVYGHPFSKRIIGNALMAYWICQGWGNNPDGFKDHWSEALAYAQNPSPQNHEAWIDALLRFQRWDYQLDTEPFVLVLDTRTRRWPASDHNHMPSGLMDRAALQETLSQLKQHPSAVVISAAPVFGLKWIETLQHVASHWGFALAVDAENWMAHGGTARTLLSYLSAGHQPITLLSGDVHYSFVYDVVLRFHGGPRLWQITASGFKNAFPKTLLRKLAQSNHWLYHPLSPLNLFTKRRKLWVQPRRVKDAEGQWVDALSHPGVGQVCFNAQGRPVHIAVFDAHHDFVFEEP